MPKNQWRKSFKGKYPWNKGLSYKVLGHTDLAYMLEVRSGGQVIYQVVDNDQSKEISASEAYLNIELNKRTHLDPEAANKDYANRNQLKIN